MSLSQSISFREAEDLLLRHGGQFAQRGVVGVGIADRNDRLQFVVAVEDGKTRDRLAQQYDQKSISGFPVHVEVGKVQSIGGLVASSRAAGAGFDLVQEVLDRPGVLVLMGFVAVGAMVYLLMG
ncbi:MAG TPA: hypothetical protein DEB06_02335 [Phycisphaerales bacterium]|nr:hypothetical protein [Phycisphaerales bacterium]